MSDDAAIFTPADLQRIESETLVRRVELHGELPSTNDLALQRAADEGVLAPLLVLAERQTAGRGRGANRWWSAPGALTFSLLLDAAAANLPTERWPQVSLTAGLAVCEALQRFLPPVEIGLKWPNDVYLLDRKVCGILVETSSRRVGMLVLGIGINVNNSFAAAPPDVRAIATSLTDVGHCDYDLTDVLIGVLNQLADRLQLLAAGSDKLWQRWQTFSMLTGRTVHLEAGSRQVTGLCKGIDRQGALILQTESATERFFGGIVRSIV
jgi:BirA family biotin operon repressor/biotin-[acetyl-CoA-carboxylase] ligase